MNCDSPGRQIKPPVRRHGERSRKLALPAECARDPLDTAAIPFRQPASAFEQMNAPRLQPVPERGAPGSERSDIVDLVCKTVHF